ncbi:MAG: hypothetical protein RXO22_05795 [Thermocladium sp.]|jgi:hypothetical protein|nr:MAG: hypothetical protein AT710_07730 [Thermocladium sp. ECH_B]
MPDQAGELRRAVELMERRGFKLIELNERSALMGLANMIVMIAVPIKDYWSWLTIDDAVKEFMLDKVDSVIIISERPYYLADELNAAIEKANLLGKGLRARVYPVYTGDMDGQLNFVLGTLLTVNYDKISNSTISDGPCPSCGEPMKLVFRHSFTAEDGQVIEEVITCTKCSVRLHRLIMQ